MNLSALRHSKEALYRTVALVAGGLIWLLLLLGTVGSILLFLVFAGISLFITERIFQAQLFGHTVRVTEKQFPEIYAIVQKCAGDMGLKTVPQVFVVNSNGLINAIAIRFLSTRYVILYSHLVDVMDAKKLSMVVAHELAHHAAGHTNFFVNLVMGPSYFVPFLGAAYSRARELTADRIAAAWLRDLEASKAALVALACGSIKYASQVDVAAFREQEASVPPIIGFLVNLFATHPRTTRRVIELDDFFRDSPHYMGPQSQAAE